MVSENSDKCVKYHRDFRMKEDDHEDEKERVPSFTPIQASWRPAGQFTPILGMQDES